MREGCPHIAPAHTELRPRARTDASKELLLWRLDASCAAASRCSVCAGFYSDFRSQSATMTIRRDACHEYGCCYTTKNVRGYQCYRPKDFPDDSAGCKYGFDGARSAKYNATADNVITKCGADCCRGDATHGACAFSVGAPPGSLRTSPRAGVHARGPPPLTRRLEAHAPTRRPCVTAVYIDGRRPREGVQALSRGRRRSLPSARSSVRTTMPPACLLADGSIRVCVPHLADGWLDPPTPLCRTTRWAGLGMGRTR